MTERSTGARLIAQYRDAVEPSEAELDAVWRDLSDPEAAPRVIEPRRGPPDRPTAPRTGPRLVVGGLVVLAAAAAVAWWVGATWRGAVAVADDSGSQAPYGAKTEAHGQRAVPREPVRVASDASASAGVEAVESAGASTTAGTPLVAREGAASTATARVRPREGEVDALAQEASLLRQAEASLREDDPAGALDVLARHARAHPKSSLAVERAALRVIALCRSGNAAQGRGEAALLEREAASKPYRERMRRACASEP